MVENLSRFAISFFFLATVAVAGCGGGATSTRGTDDRITAGNETVTADEKALAQYNHYMSQAGIALSEERQDDALEYYQLAASSLDKSGEVSVRVADAHYQAADMAYERYKKEIAIEEYQKAVDILLRFAGNAQVKAAVALTNMGVIWKELNNPARARTCWQQALAIFKAAPQSGQNLVYMQKVDKNIQDLDQGY